MNLKNSMIEFRLFQRIRREKTLLRRNMLTFLNVRYQCGWNSPIHDVKVTVRQGLFPDLGIILFSAPDGFKTFIETALTYNDREANITELRIIFEDEEDILLTFPNVTQKQEFAAALKNFLGNRSTPDPGTPLPSS